MRTILACSIFISAAVVAQGAELPDPVACASYRINKPGGDPDCDAAIAKETDPAVKSVLLFRRAYMEVAPGDFSIYPKALADLDEAIRLLPTNYLALHERAYLYNEYGRWADALNDLDAQIKLHPTQAQGYQERALSRFNLGDLQGSFDDRNTVVMLQPGNAAHLAARARAAMWLGRFDAVRSDLDKAVAVVDQTGPGRDVAEVEKLRSELVLWTKPSKAPGADACLDADKANSFEREGLIGDCTRAFLDGATPKAKADALTVRAIAWTAAQHNEANATADYRIAAALDPTNGALHSNLGFAYLQAHHSTAAVAEFDRSITLKPEFYNYAGRAAAKLNLGDLNGAFVDAKKSFELEPNELALTVLGDTLYARTKSYDEAKSYWIAAYRLGDRDDGLIARLKDAGVPIPPPPEE